MCSMIYNNKYKNYIKSKYQKQTKEKNIYIIDEK